MFVKEEMGEDPRDPGVFPALSSNEGYPLAR